MKRLKYPTEALSNMWKKNFLRDTAKFAKSTFLEQSDYLKEFKDEKGEDWRILGAMEGKDMPCEKISTGEVFIWDRWKVSCIVRHEEHEKSNKNVIISSPEKKKKTKDIVKKVSPQSEKGDQLSLFDE